MGIFRRFYSTPNSVLQKASNFVIPTSDSIRYALTENWHAVALIPSYKPGPQTLELVEQILEHNPQIHVIVIDDCSPTEYPHRLNVYNTLQFLNDSHKITLLKTPQNKLKAGAINTGLEYIKNNLAYVDVIFTLDDDVSIANDTLEIMAQELLSKPTFGAVCSQACVLNKNVNLLTRLQGLEYAMYNTVRTADAGFFKGPLVMHGMLTGFRASVLFQTNGFAIGHLIEDYEMTVRIKKLGYSVKFAKQARAWTEVPETFTQLWKQRVRWSYGGVNLVARERMFSVIIQDVIGHIFFLLTLFCVIAIFFLPIFTNNTEIVKAIILVSFANFATSYLFSLYVLRTYLEKDWLDHALRLTIIPEFIYSNILSLIVLGSYLYFAYNNSLKKTFNLSKFIQPADIAFSKVFNYFGYSQSWGTK